ncbi:MAG TPA: hypothetical protein VM011_07740 [Gammaproteobacteria bacterium]|nr:hypothetical protein [Gammaproteobacteria bacterium]
MKTLFLALILALICPNPSFAQDTSLDRGDVAVIKKKLVTVQKALGGDPDGYVLDSEEFNLPTDFNPAQAGKFRPISSSLSLRYSDKASKDSQAGVEKATEDFQAKYSAAIASGDEAAIMKMMEEMQMMATQAAAASMAPQKQPMSIYVRFNSGGGTGIDPDAVVFERAGVIAIRNKKLNEAQGELWIYIDPVALKDSKKLSKVDMSTPNDGVTKKTGVFNVTIQANGTLSDLEAWASKMDTDAMLSVIDSL